MKKHLTKLALVAGVLFTGLSASSCSKDDNGGTAGTNTVKMTVTVPDAGSDDFISVTAAAGTTSGSTSTWKINGAVQNGQQGIGLSNNDFLGATKTYVIESTRAVDAVSIGVQFINSGTPMNVTYKIEQGGKTVASETKTLAAGQDLTKLYNF